ncbi:MAG TPA: M20/M25/M40 family metallo-hydrolase [Pyrinomonadaceae bacterium]|nr:M20/M25/M40 family metallo-hydrolase [Pyrinomonadaceae bacterium]
MALEINESIAESQPVATRHFIPGVSAGSIRALGVLLFIGALVSLSIYRQNLPSAQPANAALTAFSSGRAVKYLDTIARQPHPIGSSEHEVVLNYIVRELTALGVNPSVQSTTAVDASWGGTIRAGRVQNIVARLKGTANTRAIMVVGHYDSAPTSFGASDDGAAVAMMLETLRALRAQQPLKNDVIFLFTDGEEAGLLGATAFVKQHEWFKDVGLLLNFEARGSKGPSLMFETSSQNGWLIKEFAKAAPHPISHSFAYEIYRLLPNDTDLTIFKEAGLPGLNFAFIDGYMHYHTLLDNATEMDQRSLQHHGENALALTQHFGNLDLTNREERNAVYFDVLGLTLLHYSGRWVVPLTILVVVLFVMLLIAGIKRKTLKISGILLGLVALLLSMLVSGGIVTLIWRVMQKLPGVATWTLRGDSYRSKVYLLGFVVLTIALTAMIYLFFRRKTSLENLMAGSMLLWVILLVPTSLFVPGASYLLTFPLLFSFGVFAWRLWTKERPEVTSKFLLFACLGSVPGIILLSPVIYQSFIGLTLNAIGLVMVLVVLLLGLLLPLLELMSARKWVVPGSVIALSLVLLVAIGVTSRFDADHPKMNSLFYALNADSGSATWASSDEKTDEWTAQFLSTKVEVGSLPQIFASNSSASFLQSPAPVAPLLAPEVKVLDDQRSADDERTLRLQITSPRQAAVVSLYLDSNSEVLVSSINGQEITGAGGLWSMRYYGIPTEGIEIGWKLKPIQPLRLRVVDQSYGLPVLPDGSYRSRPGYMLPFPSALNDSTFVSKTFSL